MLKIKLSVTGAKNQRSFRIVAAEARGKRDGKVVEILGHYYPHTKPAVLKIKKDRLKHWLDHGAQPTQSVLKLIKNNGKSA